MTDPTKRFEILPNLPPYKPAPLEPEVVARIVAVAQRNGGKLVRSRTGAWHGREIDTEKFCSEDVAAFVREQRAVYSQFRPGSKTAGTEITLTHPPAAEPTLAAPAPPK